MDNNAGKWQPIETAPKDGTSILGYSKVDVGFVKGLHIDDAICVCSWTGHYWSDGDCEYDDVVPTHWMPLPPPPEGD